MIMMMGPSPFKPLIGTIEYQASRTSQLQSCSSNMPDSSSSMQSSSKGGSKSGSKAPAKKVTVDGQKQEKCQ